MKNYELRYQWLVGRVDTASGCGLMSSRFESWLKLLSIKSNTGRSWLASQNFPAVVDLVSVVDQGLNHAANQDHCFV